MTRSFVFVFCVLMAETNFGDVIFHSDHFFDGLPGGWEGAGPVVIPDGGPGGDGDGYLQIIATGTGRHGSRPAIYNSTPEWTGENIQFAGDISFDMINFETSEADLEMRLVLFGPDLDNRWTSTEPVLVRNDGSWDDYILRLNEGSLTRVAGEATYDEMKSNVVRVMFRHDDGTPSAQGTPVSARAGIDNIVLGDCYGFFFCNLNGDGTCDTRDIDGLMEAFGTNDFQFDMSGDGVINNQDRDLWLEDAAQVNGFAAPFLLGDSNLDGIVNATDLNALAVNWRTDNLKWSGGNFAGFATDAGDLNELALNWQKAIPLAAATTHAVPEPSSALLVILSLVLLLNRVRLG